MEQWPQSQICVKAVYAFPKQGPEASVLGTVQMWTKVITLPKKRLPELSHKNPYELGKAVSGVANSRYCSTYEQLCLLIYSTDLLLEQLGNLQSKFCKLLKYHIPNNFSFIMENVQPDLVFHRGWKLTL